MSKLLVDTSAWIQYFRSGQGAASDRIEEELEGSGVATCGVVLAELLRGVRGKKEERLLADLFLAVDYAEIDRADWENAGRLIAADRTRRNNVPLTDALIAQVCIRRGWRLLTLDKHFELFDQLECVHLQS